MKNLRFLIPFFGVFGLILAGMATVNFLVDPAQLFHAGEREQKSSRQLASGKFIEGMTNFDDRLFQKYFVEAKGKSANTIVFGTSRSMLIQKKHFPDATFFNHSVAGGTLEDYVALTDIYIERNLKPERVVLTLEPWLLNINNRRWRWVSLRQNFFSMLDRLKVDITDGGYQEYRLANLSSLVSLKYFRNSVLSVMKHGLDEELGFRLRSDDVTPETVIRPDGSQKDPQWRLARTTEQVTAQAVQFANASPIKYLDKYESLDPELRAIFEAFVDYFIDQDIKVDFFLPPYHPVVFKTVSNDPNYQMVAAAQQYYREVATKRGIRILGSFDPTETRCGLDEFIDAHHANQDCIDRIIFDSSR